MSGFSVARANQILEAALGGASYKEGEELFLALVTVPVVGSDTGATITEVNYTGSKRLKILHTDWTAAAEGKRHNNKLFTFPECTAGASTAVGWALCTTEAPKTGDVVFSGTTPATVIGVGITPEFLEGNVVLQVANT